MRILMTAFLSHSFLILGLGINHTTAQIRTCSGARAACLETSAGERKRECAARYRECLRTGCWYGRAVQRCGYAKR
jgi:hypothetical protein